MGKRTKGEQEQARVIADECVAVRLRLLTRSVTRLYNEALRPHGLTVSQMNILVAVSCYGEARPRDVCRVLHLDKSTLSRDVERMRANGWLETTPGVDGRTSLFSVTGAGKALLRKVTPAWEEAQRRAVELLGESEIAALGRATRAVRSARDKELI
ncbi:MAG TPA: MarR family winged helix-turn-helix transcriptional regulator [Pyrinomonadaceae bacterium]